MKENSDYSKYSFWFTVLVAALMLGVSQIPGFRLGGVAFKRANIVSDVVDMGSDSTEVVTDAKLDIDTSFLLGVVLPVPGGDSLAFGSVSDVKMHEWDIVSQTVTQSSVSGKPVDLSAGLDSAETDPALSSTHGHVVAIENFEEPTMVKGHGMSHFYNAMSRHGALGRPLRIAVCGDSFTESDILSVDIRSMLQDMLGGRGVGFVPFASPVAQNRASVKHSFSGWNTDDIRNLKGMDEGRKKRFFLSGVVGRPEEGATVSIAGTTFRKHIKSSPVVKLLFVNEGHTRIDVLVNDSIRQTFTPQPDPEIQQIAVSGGDISSLSMTFTNTAGFYGYGVVMESEGGVIVDSYSVRGNSGFALMSTNADINRRMGVIMPYDLIILQYGLNVMNAGTMEYSSYRRHFANVIEFVKRCFPQSSVLVMSVSDRSVQKEGQFVTMPAVAGMITAQRAAAKQSGVAFWNMFEGMGGSGSMVRFVEKKWAAKDYTHIGYSGGKYIARKFVDALVVGCGNWAKAVPAYEIPVQIPVDAAGVVPSGEVPATEAPDAGAGAAVKPVAANNSVNDKTRHGSIASPTVASR